MRNDLGDGYVDALQKVFSGRVTIGSDLVMFWWRKAANIVQANNCRAMGLITTKSISQQMNRRVIEPFLKECSLSFAIPNHPWVDSQRGAQVRVALTALVTGKSPGTLAVVRNELPSDFGEFDVSFDIENGDIHADLTIGVDITSVKALDANKKLSSMGLILGSQGFVLSEEKAFALRRAPDDPLILPLVNGQNINANFHDRYVIDTVGWSQDNLRSASPAVYQHLLDTVFKDRQTNKSTTLKTNWWLPRRSNEQLRDSIRGLGRYIVTVETSKFRIFSFLDSGTRPEHKLVVFASDDPFFLGLLCSSVHTTWAEAAGGRNGVGDDLVYSKTTCFDPFPFPDPTETQKQTIRQLAEDLDAHRKRVQQQYPAITLTAMYNVLESLRSGGELSEQDHQIYAAALIGILRELHDSIDRAVLDAYGWPHNLTTDELLAHIVALNAERNAEEAAGHIRWLRPEFQAPAVAVPVARALEGFVEETPAAPPRRRHPWPAAIPDQFRAVKESLRIRPATAQQIASGFRRASRTRVAEILATLTALGQARLEGEKYSL